MCCVHDQLVLPCPEKPPLPKPGGRRWYHIEFTRYACPPGHRFKDHDLVFWYANCTVEKIWEPQSVKECIGK